MIKLILLVTLLMGGQPIAPPESYKYNQTYETLAECEAAKGSDQVRSDAADLIQILVDADDDADGAVSILSCIE